MSHATVLWLLAASVDALARMSTNDDVEHERGQRNIMRSLTTCQRQASKHLLWTPAHDNIMDIAPRRVRTEACNASAQIQVAGTNSTVRHVARGRPTGQFLPWHAFVPLGALAHAKTAMARLLPSQARFAALSAHMYSCSCFVTEVRSHATLALGVECDTPQPATYFKNVS